MNILICLYISLINVFAKIYENFTKIIGHWGWVTSCGINLKVKAFAIKFCLVFTCIINSRSIIYNRRSHAIFW